MPNLRGKTWTTTTPANVEDAQYWEDHLLSDNGAPKTVGTLTFKDSDGVSIDTFNGSTNKTITVGGGGHKIEDADGTTMTQQSILQFLNAEVSNDATNGKTIVDCQGEKGDTGASVDVSSSKTGKITTVEFTNADTSAVLDTITIEDGADGENGADGKSLTASHTKSGKTTTVTISDEDGTVIDTFTVTDGKDGTGSGDMAHDDYDDNYVVKNAGGIVDYVASQIPDVSGKADKATTLAGYGITDGVKEPSTEGTSGQALVTDGNGGRSWQTVTTDQYITSTSNDFSVSNKKLSLATSVTSKLSAMTVPQSTDNGKVLTANNDGTTKWEVAKDGHDMTADIDEILTVTKEENKVVNAFDIADWSNVYTECIGAVLTSGKSTIGTWFEDGETWDLSKMGFQHDSLKEASNEQLHFEFDFWVGNAIGTNIKANTTPLHITGYQWDSTDGYMTIRCQEEAPNDITVIVKVTHIRER